MSEERRTYEAMVLVNPLAGSGDWDGVSEGIRGVLERYGARVASIRKWAERKLAYPIRKQNRGTYVLVYFDAPPGAVSRIRDDLALQENVLRFLILAAQGVQAEDEAARTAETGG